MRTPEPANARQHPDDDDSRLGSLLAGGAVAGGLALLSAAVVGVGYARSLEDPYPFLSRGGAIRLLVSIHFWASSLFLVLSFGWLAWRSVEPRGRMAHDLAPGVATAAALALFLTGEYLGADQRAAEGWQHLSNAGASLGLRLADEAPRGALFVMHLLFAGTLALVLGTLAARLRWTRARVATGFAAGVAPALLALALPQGPGPRPFGAVGLEAPIWPFSWLVSVEDALGPRGLAMVAMLALALVLVAPLLLRRAPRPLRRAFVVVSGASFFVLSLP